MKNVRSWLPAILGIILIACCIQSIILVQAASATIWFEEANSEAYVGQELKMKLCISTDANLGDFEATVSYNSDILEYISGPACIASGSGILNVSDLGASSTWDTRTYVMTFKAIGVGTSLFQILNNPVVYDSSTNELMSASSSTFSVVVQPAPETSDNTRLSMMKISPGTLTPSFSSEIHEYSAIVDADISRLVVSAMPEDLSSVVTVNGNSNLKFGENRVTVLVTALSGTVSEYMILVMKEEETAIEVVTPEVPVDKPKGVEWRFEAVTDNGVTLIQGQFNYKLAEQAADVKIPAGYSKTKINIDGITINAYGDGNDDSAEFLLLILENEAGDTGLYRYDRVEKTIQRFVESSTVISSSSPNLKEQELLQDAIDLVKYQQNSSKLELLVAFLCAISVLLLIAVICLAIKLKITKDEFE